MARSEHSSRAGSKGSARADIEVADPGLLLRLAGPGSAHIKALAKDFGVSMGLRGHTIHIHGPDEQVARLERVLGELLTVLEKQHLSQAEISRAARTLRAHPDVRLAEVYSEPVLSGGGRKVIAPKGVAQLRYVQAIRKHDVVFGIGPAGTGKTYLAMAMAVRSLLEKRVQKIILTRPAVEAGERLGFLPGDLEEKIDPYLRPLYDALGDMMEPGKVAALQGNGTIEVAPLAFMRGRTLNDAFVVLDEAQNTTVAQMKMFLTRLGFGSKAVITGDSTQVDLPRGSRSGLADAVRLLRGVEGIAMSHFSDEDVVRHPLVQRIVNAYEARDTAAFERKLEREEREEQRYRDRERRRDRDREDERDWDDDED